MSDDLIPILVYADIPAAHDFLVDAFGFEGVARDPGHGEVRAAGRAIWLHRVSDEHAMAAPPAAARRGGTYVVVADIDAHHARAAAAGATIESEPTDQPYGFREYGARDPEGHSWWFGQRTGG